MRDFSIDNSAESIYSIKTRGYFTEVIKSYYNESYRSAIVMLYSIAITDLIYKLEDLKDLYSDPNAIKIINDIKTLQTNNSTSPEWERKLIEWIKEKTNLLDQSEYINLTTLQKHRHLCAHPVLTEGFNLYKPNKETTRAHIRNMLEGILTKPPLLSKNILEDFLQNLSRIQHIIVEDSDLKKHLDSRYFKKLNQKTENQIFRSLWKIIFKLDNVQCDENRNINLRALKIIVLNDYREYKTVIGSEKDFYSDFNEKYLPELINLLNQFPEFYHLFNDSAKVLIENTISKDADLETQAWFITGEIKKHLKFVLKNRSESSKEYENYWISTQSILEIYDFAVKDGHLELGNEFLIEMFGESGGYDTADTRFNLLISPYLDIFSKSELKLLVNRINSNSQIYDRRESRRTNKLVRDMVEKKIGDSFNFGKYHNFTK